MFRGFITDALYFLVGWSMQTVIDILNFVEMIRDRHVTAWKALTRPLKPTAEQQVYNEDLEDHVAWISYLNQETNHYNHKTWWAEYHQERILNVN
jgi:hypothetical protein